MIDDLADTDPVPPDKQTPPWLACALAEVGVQEVDGKGANQRILDYLATTNLPTRMKSSDETAWCSAFVNWCMLRSGIRGTNLANARSWLAWGVPQIQPKRGSVVVFSRNSAGPTSGHVGFYMGEYEVTKGTMWWKKGTRVINVLGGNQQNRVCAAEYPADRLLAIRWTLG